MSVKYSYCSLEARDLRPENSYRHYYKMGSFGKTAARGQKSVVSNRRHLLIFDIKGSFLEPPKAFHIPLIAIFDE